MLNHSKFLSKEEKEHLIKILKEDNSPQATYVLLALGTGARLSELLNITWKDFQEKPPTLHIKGLKGSNDRDIKLSPYLAKRVSLLPKDKANLFPWKRDNSERIWRVYKTANKPFHSLRHTFAMDLYAKTKDILLVKYALGHKSINSTMIYAEYQNSKRILGSL